VRRFAIILTGCLLAAGCMRDPNILKRKYLEAGNRYFAKQKYREASIMYRTAVKKDLRYGEAYYRNAMALIRLHEFAEAEGSLRRAIELLPEGPDRAVSRVQLADIYLAYMVRVQRERHVLAEVGRLCDELLSLDPNSFDGHRLRGALANLMAAELALQNPSEAAQQLRKAVLELRAADAIRPYNAEVVSALSRALWASQGPGEAEGYLRGILGAQPALASSYSELSRLYAKTNRLKDTEELLQRAIAAIPEDPKFYAELAELYEKTGRLDDMGKTLDRLKVQRPDLSSTYEVAIRLYLDSAKPELVIRESEAGIVRFPRDKAKFQTLVVDALMAQGKRAEAVRYNDQILKGDPNNADALARRGAYLVEDGEAPNAIADLEALLRRVPGHTVGHYNLGRALLAAGRQENARVQFSESVRLDPNFAPAWIALAKLQIAAGEYGKAVISTGKILARNWKHGEAGVLRSMAQRLMGKLDDARADVKRLLTLYPGYGEAWFQLGEIEVAARKWKDAEAAYRKSYQVNPSNIEGLLAIADYRIGHNDAGKALEELRAEAEKHPERLDLRLAHAAVASSAGRRDEAAGEYELLLTKVRSNPNVLADVHRHLGELYFHAGDMQRSVTHLEKARQLRPEDPAALHSLGVVYDVLGRKKEATALYEACLKVDGQNPVALNNLAFYISQNGGDLDQALTFAQRARQRWPQQLQISDTIASIYLKKNLVENALDILEDLVQKKPADAGFRFHLGQALLQKGETAKARKELQLALASRPSPEDAAKIRELLARHGT
jgi:tetratricopeptide (TPR) repeat protein